MMNKIVLAALCLSLPAFGQAVGGGGVPGAGGSGGSSAFNAITPGTNTSAAMVLGTGSSLGTSGTGRLANQIYLSAGSEIGAQCNTAVTALGATGGIIWLPNSTSATMTTTCTNIPAQISVLGYGTNASKVTCSVAGDCLQFNMNPTTTGEIGAEIAGFQMIGSGASNQVLIHAKGMSSYTLHDLEFNGYGLTGVGATCLEFENATTGQFTEGNRTYNVVFGTQCAPGVLFSQNAADSSNSFGYNDFEFHGGATGSAYLVTGTGNAFLYNGKLQIFCNHVASGSGGGCLQFLAGFGTDSSLGVPNERLYIVAEENGSGAGTVLNVPASGSQVRFYGNVVNGAFNASGTALATTYNINAGSNFALSTDMPIDVSGNFYTIKTSATGISGGLTLDETPQASGKSWSDFVQAGLRIFFDGTDTQTPLAIVYAVTSKPLIKTVSGGQFCWDSTATFANASSVCDTGISRTGANAVALGNGTQGDSSAALAVGKINVATARKGTFTCTNGGTITISNANEAATSDVVISMNTAGGTITTPPAMKTVTAATGFTVLCGATDTSVYNYDILN